LVCPDRENASGEIRTKQSGITPPRFLETVAGQ
jgi:hypothetical protein